MILHNICHGVSCICGIELLFVNELNCYVLYSVLIGLWLLRVALAIPSFVCFHLFIEWLSFIFMPMNCIYITAFVYIVKMSILLCLLYCVSLS